MNEMQALTVTPTFEETMSLGTVLAKSGYFSDAKDASQAVVKILAGRELGIGPIAAMSGIDIIKGNPTLGANVTAALIKASSKYDYRVAELTNDACELIFYENHEESGRSRFTMADAKRAGLVGGTSWQKYPRNLLFARAIKNGGRFYCPDAFGGVSTYTPEELGAVIDEGGDVIDVTPTPIPAPTPAIVSESAPESQPEPEKPNGSVGRLMATVNAKCDDYYQHFNHMSNALQKLDPDWGSWPPDDDRDAWNKLFRILVSHARQQQAAEKTAMAQAAPPAEAPPQMELEA